MTQQATPPPMSSRRPYLVRAMHGWISDNLQTPHLIVDANAVDLQIPREFVQDGKIILNISLSATQNLLIGNERIEFNARFGGKPQRVVVPLPALLGIYARESGQGIIFADEDAPPPQPTPSGSPVDSLATSTNREVASKPAPRDRVQLKVVK
jgi:stringent starvation protein B